MRPDPEIIPVLIDAARALKGSQKRLFMARTVGAMGRGGQRWAQEHLGWCRETIRKGTHGVLAIDNNAAERALKRVAIGRKNWLFAGNDRAGGTAATLYTRIASAERHGADPQRHLTSVLAKIPITPAGELEPFLPDIWKVDSTRRPDADVPALTRPPSPPPSRCPHAASLRSQNPTPHPQGGVRGTDTKGSKLPFLDKNPPT